MKVYFYGATKEEAEEKCQEFWKELLNNLPDPADEELEVNAVRVIAFNSTDPRIPKDYRVHVYCDVHLKKEHEGEG